jgi:anhydro-N-acetylmuramic acid kinase
MKLKTYRALLNISQAKLAQLIGVTELSVLKYEAGTTIPARATMLRIYQLSSGAVTANDFYDLEGLAVTNRIDNVREQAQKDAKLVVGLMSGTSMDGIDAALLLTDGQSFVKDMGSASLKYSDEFRARLKLAESAVREALGDLNQARIICPTLDQIITESTDLHVDVTEHLLQKYDYRANQIHLVGYHGQTLFHRPAIGITVQVGDGKRLAQRLKIPVVYDFRINDVRHGGQGAPFAPLYHEALALQMGLAPVVVANCGGISNITVITGQSKDLFAFDCGPGNGLIDRFVSARTGKHMDEDGVFGLQGSVNESVLGQLRQKALILADGSAYFDKQPPKSLDIHDLQLIAELDALSLQDGCATLEAFTADCIVKSLRWVEERGVLVPTFWVLGGGGWNNPVIVRELETQLKVYLGTQVKVQRAEAVGWNGTALEAQIFAYLAMRSKLGLPISVPGTTGVAEPLTGGIFVD